MSTPRAPRKPSRVKAVRGRLRVVPNMENVTEHPTPPDGRFYPPWVKGLEQHVHKIREQLSGLFQDYKGLSERMMSAELRILQLEQQLRDKE
jgi:hypothetical protein